MEVEREDDGGTAEGEESGEALEDQEFDVAGRGEEGEEA